MRLVDRKVTCGICRTRKPGAGALSHSSLVEPRNPARTSVVGKSGTKPNLTDVGGKLDIGYWALNTEYGTELLLVQRFGNENTGIIPTDLHTAAQRQDGSPTRSVCVISGSTKANRPSTFLTPIPAPRIITARPHTGSTSLSTYAEFRSTSPPLDPASHTHSTSPSISTNPPQLTLYSPASYP